MSRELECVLCGETSSDVRVSLLRFEAGGEFYFGTDPRCTDHVACQKRVEAKGQEWPIAAFHRKRASA